jgi:hypothetical protein
MGSEGSKKSADEIEQMKTPIQKTVHLVGFPINSLPREFQVVDPNTSEVLNHSFGH